MPRHVLTFMAYEWLFTFSFTTDDSWSERVTQSILQRPSLMHGKTELLKNLWIAMNQLKKPHRCRRNARTERDQFLFFAFFFLNWILDTFWFPDVTVSSIHILMYSPSCKNNMVLSNSCYRAWSTCNLLGGCWFTGRRSHCSVRAVSKYFMPFILFIKFFTYLIFPFLGKRFF